MNVNDLTFESKASQETINAAGKWLEDNKASFKSTSAFVIMGDDPKLLHPVPNGACHAAISTPSVPEGQRAVVATEIAIDRAVRLGTSRYFGLDKVGKEVYFPMLRWLTQDSHFARFIVNKDDWDFIISNGIIVSADMPAPLLQNIMIISRHFKECYPRGFDQFNKWLEKYPKAGTLLFNICFCSSISTSVFNGTEEAQKDPFIYSTGASHRIVGLFPTLEELNNFCSGEYGPTLKDDSSLHYRNNQNYMGGSKYGRKVDKVGRILSDSGSTFIHELIRDHPDFKKELQKHRGVSEAAPIIKNPFARPSFTTRTPTDSAVCKLSEFDEIILPYIFDKGLIPSVN